MKEKKGDLEAEEKQLEAEIDVEYKGTPRRWLILLVVALAQANSNIIFNTLPPIVIPVA